jgi:hypothetical protein
MMRTGVVILAVLSIALLCMPLRAQQGAVLDAMGLVTQGEHEAAYAALYPLIQASPNDASIRHWLGRACYGMRFYRMAAEHLAVAAQRDPANSEFLLWHARALRAGGAFAEAADAYALYFARAPQDAANLADYATVQTLAGDFPGARQTFRRLEQRDRSADMREWLQDWAAILHKLASQASLEPTQYQRTAHFELRYDSPLLADALYLAVADAHHRIVTVTGLPVQDFRVLAFSDWRAYTLYAHTVLLTEQEMPSAAFSLPDALVLYVPPRWPNTRAARDEFANLLRHEMVHLAIARRTQGEGVPIWFNEGLACFFGQWAGMQGGQLPAKPWSGRMLDHAFRAVDAHTREQAYAQAHAMTTVLLQKIGQDRLPHMLDRLAQGMPLALVYQELGGEPYSVFLAQWPDRYHELAARPRE